MIEIIYKGEDEGIIETDMKLPKNVRQIGNCESDSKKIYVEDFVMTYVKHFSTRKLKYGALLGNVRRINGNTYVFINGAVSANALLDNEIVFDEDVWTGIYEEIKTYFDDVEIVGWFASMPSVLSNDMPQIQKIHLDNFAGNNKVFLLLDKLEGDDTFYIYEEGGMRKNEGFYIYYEKNADMQAYMAMHVETQNIPEEYEQTNKNTINARVHKLFVKNEKHKENYNENQANKPDEDFKLIDIENIDYMKKDRAQKDKNARRMPTFAYSASSFMLIAILVGTIALLNASGQLKDLKGVISGFVNEKSDPNSNKDTNAVVVDVNGEVETTTAVEQSQTTPVVTQPQTESQTQPPTEQQTQPETQQPTASVSTPEVQKNYYQIQSGDSLYSICMRTYGNIEMLEKIKQENNIVDENKIKEGDTIVLP